MEPRDHRRRKNAALHLRRREASADSGGAADGRRVADACRGDPPAIGSTAGIGGRFASAEVKGSVFPSPVIAGFHSIPVPVVSGVGFPSPGKSTLYICRRSKSAASAPVFAL